MRTSVVYLNLFVVVILVSLGSCERQRLGCTDPRAGNYDVGADVDDGSCDYNSGSGYSGCTPDNEGNLVINNTSDKKYYLYSDNIFVTCIPGNAVDFLVFIPNQNLEVCHLQLWKAEDVEDQMEPDIEFVYRQWSVALSNTTNTDERSYWLITGKDEYIGSGTVSFSYPDKDEFGQDVLYQVDIFLNDKNGAKLASFKPGSNEKKVSINYGVHYLYFHYWYSDPESSAGDIQDIGWQEYANLVMNEIHNYSEVDIPVFRSTVGKYGELKVINNRSSVVNVYANDVLIENIVKIDGSSQGLSSIPANEESTFVIPVGTYTITIKTIDGTVIKQFTNIDVDGTEMAVLNPGLTHKSLRIVNNSTMNLGVFDTGNNYLGYKIDAGETRTSLQIPDSITKVKVMDFTGMYYKVFDYNSSVTIDELDEMESGNIDFIYTWNQWDSLGVVYYYTPNIDHNDNTTMIARLEINSPSKVSFEYKVSSEAGYDFFTFLIDDMNAITPKSGEIDWTEYSEEFEKGIYTLTWKYTKDSMMDEGTDNVQLRNIKIEKL